MAAIAVALATMKDEVDKVKNDAATSSTVTAISELTSACSAQPQQTATDRKLQQLIKLLKNKDNGCSDNPTSNCSATFLRQSDGPPGTTKTEKYYKKSNTVCFTCGYDVSKNHHSGNCRRPGPNHDPTHSGENPRPGANQKDKEFSRWKDQPIPTA